MATKTCGNCGARMKELQTRCKCGWQDPGLTAQQTHSPNWGYCAVPGCRNPGVFSNAIRGESTWYCGVHDGSNSTARQAHETNGSADSQKKLRDILRGAYKDIPPK